ncbi:hypothetical protein WAI453_005914 [Rhynchosporium graminicola]
MGSNHSKDTDRSVSSKKKSKDGDNDNDKRIRHRIRGISICRSSLNPIPETDKITESSTQEDKSVLGSAVFRDETDVTNAKTSKTPTHDNVRRTGSSSRKDSAFLNSAFFRDPENGPKRTKPRLKSAYTSPKDIQMASKQTSIRILSRAERDEQERWAQEKLTTHGDCTAGYAWWEYNLGVDTKGKKA